MIEPATRRELLSVPNFVVIQTDNMQCDFDVQAKNWTNTHRAQTYSVSKANSSAIVGLKLVNRRLSLE